MTYLTIKQLPFDDRPYEKLETNTENSLSNAELLAIIIKSGMKNATSVQIAQKVLSLDTQNKGLCFLFDLSLEDLRKIKGIGRVKSIQIKAAIELAKRLNSKKVNNGIIIKSPIDVSNLVMDDMRYLKQEILKTVILDTKNKVLKQMTNSVGGLNRNVVQAREIFSEPIKLSAASVILVHNHPSGDCTPSKADIAFTQKYMEYGKMLGIDVLDHVVIGNGVYTSLKEQGLV